MTDMIKEYSRIINSLAMNEQAKEDMFYRVTENMGMNKYGTKKQIVAASVAAATVAVCVSCLIKTGTRIR